MRHEGTTAPERRTSAASGHGGPVGRCIGFLRSDLGYGRTTMVWALFQSVFLPVPVELWVGAVALFGRYRGLRAVLWAIIGATLGGLLVALLPGAALGLMVSMPWVDPALLDAADRRLLRDGWWAFVVGPWEGIPHRVLAAVAGFREMSPLGVLFITPIARGATLLPVAMLLAAVRTALRPRIDRQAGAALALYATAALFVLTAWLVTGP